MRTELICLQRVNYDFEIMSEKERGPLRLSQLNAQQQRGSIMEADLLQLLSDLPSKNPGLESRASFPTSVWSHTLNPGALSRRGSVGEDQSVGCFLQLGMKISEDIRCSEYKPDIDFLCQLSARFCTGIMSKFPFRLSSRFGCPASLPFTLMTTQFRSRGKCFKTH